MNAPDLNNGMDCMASLIDSSTKCSQGTIIIYVSFLYHALRSSLGEIVWVTWWQIMRLLTNTKVIMKMLKMLFDMFVIDNLLFQNICHRETLCLTLLLDIKSSIKVSSRLGIMSDIGVKYQQFFVEHSAWHIMQLCLHRHRIFPKTCDRSNFA